LEQKNDFGSSHMEVTTSTQTNSDRQLSALHEAAVRLIVERCFDRCLRPIDLVAALTDGYRPHEVVGKLEKITGFFTTADSQIGALRPNLTRSEWEKVIGFLGISAGDWVDLAERILKVNSGAEFDRSPGYQRLIEHFYQHCSNSNGDSPLTESTIRRPVAAGVTA
jgi:hypothetical protein